MIEAVLFNTNGDVISRPEPVDTAELAVFAGQTIYDDAIEATSGRGSRFRVGFFIDGKLLRLVDGRPCDEMAAILAGRMTAQ
jgi:hypothetical protein